MSNDPVEILDAGEQLRDEIETGPFDRFVVFTYGITPEYLDWFDPDDQVVICGPNETVETVDARTTASSIAAYNRETHAKIYLLYNESRIVAYLGSFNFTRSGLYGSVEWGARYEGELEQCPSPQTLIDGEAPTTLSTSPMIEQIANIVGASMTGKDTQRADAWRATTDEGVVHTLTSNTLQDALTEMLQSAETPVEISYYTPFVTRPGLTEFHSYLPETLNTSEVTFTVYTKRINRLQDDESILTPEEVAALDEKFGAFRLRVRAPGDQGNQLGDGREIRNGMAHLKAITLTERPETDHNPLGTILTSANLSQRAWSRESSGFEVGVAIENTHETERLQRLFAEDLPHAYATPSSRELNTAGGSGTPQTDGTEQWLDTRLLDRLRLTHDTVSINWSDTLPTIESLHGRLKVRDLSTGERTTHEVQFSTSDSEFVASFPSVTNRDNQIVDFIRLTAETRHAPPELEYTAREVSRLRAEQGLDAPDDPLPEAWQSYDQILWSGTDPKPVAEASFGDVATVGSVQLRSTHDEMDSHYAIFEPDTQPHIDSLLQEVNVDTAVVDLLGELPTVCVATHPTVELGTQQIGIYTTRGNRVRPLGFRADSDQRTHYYLPPEYAGEKVRIEVKGPIGRYIQHENRTVRLPALGSEGTVELKSHVPTELWRVAPTEVHPVLNRERYPDAPDFVSMEPSVEDHISTERQVRVTPPEQLSDQQNRDRLAFWWRPSGVFHAGTVQSVSSPIPKQAARTRVTYRGIVQLDGDGGRVNVWLPGGQYVVREQPFVENIEVSLSGVPDEQTLSDVNSDTVLGWATIQRRTLLKPRARDVTPRITTRLYVDGTSVARREFAATRNGGVLCIPIMGRHIGHNRDLTLRLWVNDGPAKASTYTEAASSMELSIDEVDDGLRVSLGDVSQTITDASTTPVIDFREFIDHLEVGVLEEGKLSQDVNEPFSVKSYDPLTIQPEQMFLLCLT